MESVVGARLTLVRFFRSRALVVFEISERDRLSGARLRAGGRHIRVGDRTLFILRDLASVFDPLDSEGEVLNIVV